MALTPSQITAAVIASKGVLNGPAFFQLAAGVGNGVGAWAVGNPANLSLQGVATGLAGTGNILAPTTKIIVSPNVGAVLGALSGAGLNGPMASSLATAVGVGVAQAFTSSAQYTGVSAGVGSGQDVSVIVVSNPAALVGILMGTLSGAFGSSGPAMGLLATGLGNGIASMLLGASATGTITGVAGPSPASGTTTSVVV